MPDPRKASRDSRILANELVLFTCSTSIAIRMPRNTRASRTHTRLFDTMKWVAGDGDPQPSVKCGAAAVAAAAAVPTADADVEDSVNPGPGNVPGCSPSANAAWLEPGAVPVPHPASEAVAGRDVR